VSVFYPTILISYIIRKFYDIIITFATFNDVIVMFASFDDVIVMIASVDDVINMLSPTLSISSLAPALVEVVESSDGHNDADDVVGRVDQMNEGWLVTKRCVTHLLKEHEPSQQ